MVLVHFLPFILILTSTALPTLAFGTAWRPCNEPVCPSDYLNHPSEILAKLKSFSGACRLRTKNADRLSPKTDSAFSASDSVLKCTGRTEHGVPADAAISDRAGWWRTSNFSPSQMSVRTVLGYDYDTEGRVATGALDGVLGTGDRTRRWTVAASTVQDSRASVSRECWFSDQK